MIYRFLQKTAAHGRCRGAIIALALLCLSVSGAMAGASGSQVLTNGTVVEWQVSDDTAEPRLGLNAPAFLQWSPSGFEVPLTVEMRSDALSAVDAWELAFYRQGDTHFARPVRRFRGDARTIDQPVRWAGDVEDGPRLRPGEKIVALLSVRDVAGNIDHARPQEILIARYRMRAERRALAAIDKVRARMLQAGERPDQSRMPMRGAILTLRMRDWPDGEEPRASGLRFRRTDDMWTLRQILPAGRHDIVIQATRKILGGVRAVPVGVVSVEMPPTPPLKAAVKGTGKLVKTPIVPAQAVPLGDLAEWTVQGDRAVSRILTKRDATQDRLALSLLATDRPVPMTTDARMRRVLLSSYGETTVAWPAGYDSGSLSAPAARRMTVAFEARDLPELVLPHTDILPDSVGVTVADDGEPLMPFRDYFLNTGEGRILLGSAALSRLAEGGDAALKVSYTVPAFTPEVQIAAPVRNGGAVYDRVWAIYDPASSGAHDSDPDDSLLGRMMRWFRGED